MARRLKVEEWPEPDRLAWIEARRPGVRLQRGGRAAHMSVATQIDLEGRFGGFLGFLDRTGRLRTDRSALVCIKPEVIEKYITELQARLASVTVYGSIYKLRRMAEILNTELDLRWLREIELDLEDQKRPAPKGPRVVNSDRIFTAGIDLIRSAETETHRTDLQRARLARDGLLIAFLAVCPIRLKNLAALTIGNTIVHEGYQWWLLLPDEDTKSRRLDHRVIPDVLAKWIDLYMDTYKPVFPASETAMWPSQYGGPMSYAGVQRLVSDTTKRVLGKAVGPHMFRHCVPYTIANIDGSRIDLASSVLQHSDPRITQKHYNLAHSVESSRAFGNIVSDLLKAEPDAADARKRRP